MRSHSPRRGEGEHASMGLRRDKIPQLALSVVSSGSGSPFSESPQTPSSGATLSRGGGGDRIEEDAPPKHTSTNNTDAGGMNRGRISNRNRLGSISDTEDDEDDDVGEAMPGTGESGVDGLEERYVTKATS